MMIELTHANNGTQVLLVPELIFAVLTLPANGCTAVMAAGGAMVPVTETPAQVNQKLIAAKLVVATKKEPLKNAKQQRK